MEVVSKTKVFGGWLYRCKHVSATLGNLPAAFAVFMPPGVSEEKTAPVIYWLSGLTCTEENFITKTAGAFGKAAELQLALVVCDTSPRGAGFEEESKSYDLGLGAGFYVNATRAPWKANYRMYDYVVSELPQVVAQQPEFHIDHKRQSLMGHSMGGHGALVIGLRNPTLYKCVSAFAPICHPSNCAWGRKAFAAYLGEEGPAWKEYDACELVKAFKGAVPLHMKVDQGSEDQFLKDGQLQPEALKKACDEKGVELDFAIREGYDHSYYFIATFIESHLIHHVKYL